MLRLNRKRKSPMVVEVILGFLFFYFLAMPFLTLLHELGHGIVPYFWEKSSISVRVGPKLLDEKRKPLLHLQSQRAELRITSLSRPWQGYCGWSHVSSYKERIVALILGPLVSLFLAILIGASLYLYWTELLLGLRVFGAAAALFALTQFLITAIPMTYPKLSTFASNSVSDGKQIFYLYNKYHRAPASSTSSKNDSESL